MLAGLQRVGLVAPRQLALKGRSGSAKALGVAITQRQTVAALYAHSRRPFSSRNSNSKSNGDEKNSGVRVMGSLYPADEWTNATPAILEKTGRNLLHKPSHPLAILKDIIFKEFPTFAHYDALSPVVSTFQNFDSLGFAKDHPGRSKTDTYYVNEKTLLRTHTSAHQLQLLAAGAQKDAGLLEQAKNGDKAARNERFLVAADVYRRDEIDSSHYPVFHQMEGVCTFSRNEIQKMMTDQGAAADNGPAEQGGNAARLTDTTVIGDSNPKQMEHTADEVAFLVEHMKQSMNRMVVQILTRAMAAKSSGDKQTTSSDGNSGNDTRFPVRWIDAYFPFTSPSWEMEVLYQGEWLEICGCGVMKQEILDTAGMTDRVGWAFGFGLERLAMLLFGIPDIRLFWSTDPRFTDQFQADKINTFRPFSRHPVCPKDISFWIPNAAEFHENDVMDLVRETAGDLVEGVKLIDSFTHPKTGKESRCYRINYCSMDRNVTNEEINGIQDKVRDRMVRQLKVTLR